MAGNIIANSVPRIAWLRGCCYNAADLARENEIFTGSANHGTVIPVRPNMGSISPLANNGKGQGWGR